MAASSSAPPVETAATAQPRCSRSIREHSSPCLPQSNRVMASHGSGHCSWLDLLDFRAGHYGRHSHHASELQGKHILRRLKAAGFFLYIHGGVFHLVRPSLQASRHISSEIDTPRTRLLVRFGSKPILVSGNFLGGMANILNGLCWYVGA